MKNNCKNIPEWLLWPIETTPPAKSQLSESREEMYKALSIFYEHVKYVIYIMISMPTVILIIMRLWPTECPNVALYIISGIILIFVIPVGLFSIRIIRRYYEVYVSALVYATRVHIGLGYEYTHPWIERTIKQAQDMPYVDSSLKFLEERSKSTKDTFALYRWIIIILSICSLLCGIVFLSLGLR